MTSSIIFRSPEARARIATWFERFREKAPVPTRAREVSTRFGATHVLVAGPEHAPPLVCVHGAMASSAHLLPELGPLLTRFRVHAVDVIGQSVKSADVRVPVDGPAYAEWLTDVLDALGLPRAHLLGVSWGGFVALRMAEVAPARIDRLVLIVPGGVVSGPVWQGLTRVAIPMALYRAFPSEDRLARLVSGLFTTHDAMWGPYFGDAVRSYRLDMRIPPLATPEALAGFTRPALVFGADDDVSFPGAKLLARAKVLLPRAETELLEGCRHSPPTDDAFRARLGGRIARFLEPDAAAPFASPGLASPAA
ncbi:alpha/beta hydrolase [Sorangium cellulosum]|uniref:Alpha/beta hydrolase n=1 Tax=Sorangium cellulosum TaxID=56 RepID=A0A150TAE1_SORCE|nr:alpha/beta hydrolase [Sorangium cellulosum]